jgi:uncharacterized membrane protein YhaH (DUF805 family)
MLRVFSTPSWVGAMVSWVLVVLLTAVTPMVEYFHTFEFSLNMLVMSCVSVGQQREMGYTQHIVPTKIEKPFAHFSSCAVRPRFWFAVSFFVGLIVTFFVVLDGVFGPSAFL